MGILNESGLTQDAYDALSDHDKLERPGLFCDCARGKLEENAIRSNCQYNLEFLERVKRNWEAKKQGIIERHIDESGLPTSYRDYSIASYRALVGTNASKRDAGNMAYTLFNDGKIGPKDAQKNSLFLYGPMGVGKRGCLVPLLLHYIRKGRTGLYMDYLLYMRSVRAGYEQGAADNRSAHDLVDRAINADVLLIQGLGWRKHPPTEHTQTVIFEILSARCTNQAMTLITSTLSPSEIEEQFGEEAAYYLRKMAVARAVSGPCLG
jgi:DNA replication protein DnaC